MARPRVEADRLRELIRLHRMGSSARQVVRLLHMSPKTERRYRVILGAAGLLEGPLDSLPTLAVIRAAVRASLPKPAPVASSVDAWRADVQSLADKGLTARAVYDRLQLEPVFQGSYSAVKRLLRRLTEEQGAQAEDVAVPVVTVPGQEAQVDFGYAGRLYDPATGRERRTWVFVMVACHSRRMFVRLVFDQKTETWLSLHEQAFVFFGGVFEVLVPDNTRRAVLRAAFGLDGTSELERSYRELAQHYGFKIDPAPPGEPRKRGKVEAAVKYLRNNPLKGRAGESIVDVEASLQRWNREIASKRIHGTTGRRPIEVFTEEEQEALLPLPSQPFKPVVWKRPKVHSDSHVTCRGRLFSVPWQLLHERVWVRACGQTVEVFHNDALVAVHHDTGQRRSTREEHLPEDRRQFRHRSQEYWSQRANAIGPETAAFVTDLFDLDEVLSYLRTVQASVKHLESFPARRAEAACKRARRLEDYSYQGLKQALAAGLDLAELEPGPRPSPSEPVPPPCESCGATS